MRKRRSFLMVIGTAALCAIIGLAALFGARTGRLFPAAKLPARAGEPSVSLQTKQQTGLPPAHPAAPRDAMIRLEDVGPGGQYGTPEGLGKLRAVMDYLSTANVPFQICLIPDWVTLKTDGTWYHRTLGSNSADPYMQSFVQVMRDAEAKGALIGMEGYSHQYGEKKMPNRNEDSAIGSEFNVPRTPRTATVPYAINRMALSLAALQGADLHPAFWASPHFRDTYAQEKAFRSEIGILYQPEILTGARRRSIYYADTENTYGSRTLGSVYVPMPLGYVNGRKTPQQMLSLAERRPGLASLYFHPFLEFSHLAPVLGADGKPELQDGVPLYRYRDDHSPLHQVVEGFRQAGYRWISLGAGVPFTPAQRIQLPRGTFPQAVLIAPREGNAPQSIWALAGNRALQYAENYAWPRNRRQPPPADRGRVPFSARYGEPLLMDLFGGGKPDLLVYDKRSGKVTVYAANANGTAYGPPAPFGSLPAGFASVQAVRFQGAPALLGATSRELALFVPSAFTRQWKPAVVQLPVPNGAEVWSVPLTAGGDDALFLYQPGTGSLFIYPGMNTARSIPVRIAPPFAGARIQAVAGDFNGDGWTDLALYNPDSGMWEILRNQGQNRYAVMDFLYGPWGRGKAKLAMAGDFDGNGKADIALYDRHTNVLDISLSFQPE